jgi:DNA-binding SARP family transcriptional activator
MNALRIAVLGQFQIGFTNRTSELRLPRSSRSLLAYLLLQRRSLCSRDLLAGLFWGDYPEDKARHCLNSALWRLRQILEPDDRDKGSVLIATCTGEIGFNWESNHWLDVAIFDEQVTRLLTKPLKETDARTLDETLLLYRGDLLEGFYDDWALSERERVRRLFLNGLAKLMYYHRDQGAFEDSLACAERILAQEPLREEIHREMMRLFLMNGQRALALRQYERCCDVLATELGIGPMEETQALYERILTPTADEAGHPNPNRESKAGGREAVEQLRLAMERFNQARQQLHRAIQLVEQLALDHDQSSRE